MESLLHLQIVTNSGSVVDEYAGLVSLPAADGEVGILPKHSPMIAALREGVVKYKVDGEDRYAAVSGGVMSVADDELIVLARSAETAESIDLARAQASERRAKERIASKSSEWDMSRAELSLKRALAREKAYSMRYK